MDDFTFQYLVFEPGTIVEGCIFFTPEISIPGIEIDGSVLALSAMTGIRVSDDVTLRGLVVNRCQYGIWIPGSNVTVEDCYVGTGPGGISASPNVLDWILVADGSTNSVIQNILLSWNTGNGIRLFGENTIGDTLRNNRIGTNIAGTGASAQWRQRYPELSRRNNELAPPVVTSAGAIQISGTGMPNSQIEFFSNCSDEGAKYEGSIIADASGSWTLSRPILFTGPYITAVAIDTEGNTSEFRKADFALAVELTSFEAAVRDANVILHWTTASEINNYGFDIERIFISYFNGQEKGGDGGGDFQQVSKNRYFHVFAGANFAYATYIHANHLHQNIFRPSTIFTK